MFAFSFFLYFGVFFIHYSYAVDYSRTFHSPDMCQKDGNCSFQFPSPLKNNCFIYGTSDCENYDFTTWNLQPFFKPAMESESEFTVSIVPYAAYIADVHKNNPVSAINISLTSLNKAISGFLVVMTRQIEAKNICRIFDFRNSLGTFNIPFTLFYDCFRYLTEDHWEDVIMKFQAYPLNMELSYFVHIPPKPKKIFTSACDWVPLVMIFQGSLPEHHVQIKFSNAPKELNISFFLLTLWNSRGEEIIRARIPSTVKEDMISKELISLEGGFYSISIDVILAEKSCTVFISKDFLIGNIQKDHSLVIFIILLIIMIISGSFLLYFSCKWYLKSAVPATKPIVLFVYHYKSLQHKFLELYGKYLENYYGVKVNTIYEKRGDPKAWLEAKYLESQIIIFVISEGLSHAFEQKISYEEEHHWVNQLTEAKALINYSYIGEKRICKICFPYSERQYVPKSLEHHGPLFMLPNDTDKFLCFIHTCSKKLYLLSKLFCENHHKVQITKLKHNDDAIIKEKLSSLVENKLDETIIENLSNLIENKVDVLPSVNFKKVPEISIQEEYKKEPHILTQNCHLNSINDSINECKAENIASPKHEIFSKQESDSEESENDDFFLYCVRKMLSSQ